MSFETPDTLNQDDREVLEDLRNRGFAISVWTPDELNPAGVSIRDMEDHLAEAGNAMLDFHLAFGGPE